MGVTEILTEIQNKAGEGLVGIAAELQGKYDEGFVAGKDVGFKEGQASIVLPDPTNPDKIYTQADMDNLAGIVRGEKDAEYGPQLAEKDQAFANQGAELASVKLDFETLKADFDSKVVNGAMERVTAIKTLAKDAVAKMVLADQPIADQAVSEIENA